MGDLSKHEIAQIAFNPATQAQKRETLEHMLAEFERKGGRITSLAPGETLYRDGILPSGNKRPPHQPDDNSRIESLNAAIRERKEQRVERIQRKKRKPYKKIFEKSLEGLCTHPLSHIRLLVKLHIIQFKGKQRAKPLYRRPVDATEAERRKTIKTAFQEAIAANKVTFEAPCRNHGLTTYRIFSVKDKKISRCTTCHKNQKAPASPTSVEQIDRTVRCRINKERMQKALSANQMYFIGECGNCGPAKFKISHNKPRANRKTNPPFRCHCVSCMNNSSRKDKHIRKAELLRRKAVFILYQDALAQQQTTFEAPCAIHGTTPFIIREEGALCRICFEQNIQDDLSKPLNQEQIQALQQVTAADQNAIRIAQNNANLEKAVASGQACFSGGCKHCGPTTFRIFTVMRKGVLRKEYACQGCRKKRGQKDYTKKKERASA